MRFPLGFCAQIESSKFQASKLQRSSNTQAPNSKFIAAVIPHHAGEVVAMKTDFHGEMIC
jgi:hypothetical protein